MPQSVLDAWDRQMYVIVIQCLGLEGGAIRLQTLSSLFNYELQHYN